MKKILIFLLFIGFCFGQDSIFNFSQLKDFPHSEKSKISTSIIVPCKGTWKEIMENLDEEILSTSPYLHLDITNNSSSWKVEEIDVEIRFYEPTGRLINELVSSHNFTFKFDSDNRGLPYEKDLSVLETKRFLRRCGMTYKLYIKDIRGYDMNNPPITKKSWFGN